MTEQATTRRYDIDWLRIFATYLLFIFHVGKVFDTVPFYQIKDPSGTPWLNDLTGFIHLWHMPLFFLLAGWAVYPSLNKRGGSSFLAERGKRLMVPFVFGCLVFCPPMNYVYAITALDYQGSFINFLPLFFTSLKYFSWSHLWFILYLATFTFLYYPLLKRLLAKMDPERSFTWKAVYSPLLLLILIQVTLRPIWPGWQNLIDDWANFTFYSTFFLTGFLFAGFPKLEKTMQELWKHSLLLGVLGILFMEIATAVLGWGRVSMAFFAVSGYGLVLFLLGLGHRVMNRTTRLFPYLRESAYPVYLLHQICIVLPGYFVVRLDWPVIVKFPLLVATAVILATAIYLAIVKPFKPLRFVMGMRAK